MTSNPYAPPRAAVRDIAERHATAEPADRGTRLGAAILDGIIFGAMVYVPFMFVAMIGGAANGRTGYCQCGYDARPGRRADARRFRRLVLAHDQHA